jgi:glycosyltransferase involved in cell wall biosynthesis
MRILFVHQNFPAQYAHLAPALAARGHSVVAVCMNAPGAGLPGVRVVRYGVKPPPPRQPWDEAQTKMARGMAVAATLRGLKAEGFTPDLVCAHPAWGEVLFLRDVFPAAKLVAYAEFFFQPEGADVDFDPEFLRPAADDRRLDAKNLPLLQALVHADAAVSPTQFQRARHPALLQPKIEVIHDGIDTARFRPDPAAHVTLRSAGLVLRPGDEVVTFVVRQLEPYRGYHRFMRALPRLLALRPQARVVLVGGDGTSYGAKPPAGTTWKQQFLDEVQDGLDLSRVHFVGRLPHTTLTELMQVSAVHVYLTYPFVLSWSLLEAMSCGCLVVGSRTAPVEEVISHGDNGLLVDFFDAEALAASVADALARRGELVHLREAARRTVQERFDLAAICLPTQLALVERVLAT